MYIMIICHWAILHYNNVIQNLQEGLMVFFDDFLYFLKIKIFFPSIDQNYLVALNLTHI